MTENELNNSAGDGQKDDIKYHLAGWILFIVCAGFFIASSVKNGDWLTLVASIIFLMACVIFIIPLAKTVKGDH